VKGKRPKWVKEGGRPCGTAEEKGVEKAQASVGRRKGEKKMAGHKKKSEDGP